MSSAHNYYWTASHAVGCRAKERSSTPSFVQKFEKKFAYTPSASPYFTSGHSGLNTPEPQKNETVPPDQVKEPRHPTSADVPKPTTTPTTKESNVEMTNPPIQTTTNVKQVPTTKDNQTTNEPTDKKNDNE